MIQYTLEITRFLLKTVWMAIPSLLSVKGGFTSALMVIHCNDPGCSGMDEVLQPVDKPCLYVFCDGRVDIGHFASMAIGSDGAPIISYINRGRDDTESSQVQ